MPVPDRPTTYGNTTEARKYLYVYNEIIKTWRQTSFAAENLNRYTARIANGGRQAIIPLETSGNGSFRFMGIGESLPEPGSATYTEAVVDFTTCATTAEFDEWAKAAAETNQQSFIDIKMKAVADATEAIGYRWSHALMIPKTGAVARLKANTTGTTWSLYTDTETGNGGTFGARFLPRNGMVSLSTTTTGLVTEVDFVGATSGVNYIANTATFTGTGTGNLVADQYVYWGTKDRTSKGRALTGLPVIVDDGTNYAVFEGRNRTTAGNEDWQAGYTASFGTGSIELEMINQSINRQLALPGNKTDVVWYGLKTQRLHWQQQSATRQSMMPVSGMKDGPTFMGGWKALPVYYGNDVLLAMATPEYTDNKMYGLNWEGLGLAMLREPQWLNEGEGDFKYITDTMNYRGYIYSIGQLASKLPAMHWQTDGITP